MNFGRKLLNFYLYSNLHIALAATALTLYTYRVHQLIIDYAYLLFVFSSTLLLYAVHRAIGIRKTQEAPKNDRFDIIESYRKHIFFYALVGLIGSTLCFLQFERSLQIKLILPIFLSGLYAIPLIGKKRIRDFHYIKIFLVAVVWSWISFSIPHSTKEISILEYSFLFIERAFFIFAITIPFDIRDIKTDRLNQVKTLVHGLGVRNSKILSLFLLTTTGGILLITVGFNSYSFAGMLSYIIAGVFINFSSENKSDTYYTLWLDGTMALPLIITSFLELIKFTS